MNFVRKNDPSRSKGNIILKIFILLIFNISSIYSVTKITQELPPSIKKILKQSQFDHNHLYFAYFDLDDEKNNFQYNANQYIWPASIAKILTAAYALKKLGPNFRFKTKLFYTGEIKNGILYGDLYLKGYGDPSFSMARLMNLAMELRLLGIKDIKGSYFFDESIQPTTHFLEVKFGLGDQTYNPGLGALNLEFNRFQLHKNSIRKTSKAHFTPLPNLPHIEIKKNKQLFSPGKKFHFNPQNPGEVWELSTTQNYSSKEELPVRKPSRFCAEAFRYLSSFWGISLKTPRQGTTPKHAILIAEDESNTLIELLSQTLEYSNNLYAEQILLKAANEKDLAKAAEKMKLWLKSILPQSKFNLVNGSGLSSENQIRPIDLAMFLDKYALRDIGGRGFMSLFSISAQSGWLKKRLFNPNLAFRVWAKTGSLDYVNNIAGVLFPTSGKRFVFVLGLHDFKNRTLLNGVNSQKINKIRNKALRWSRKATKVQDEILNYWINKL